MGEAILKIKQMRDSSWFWYILLLPLALLVIWVLWQMDADARRMRDMANRLEEERRRAKHLKEEAAQNAMAAEQEALQREVDAARKRIVESKQKLTEEVKRNEAKVEAIRNTPDSDVAGILAAYDAACRALETAEADDNSA
jgi:cytochrome c biogenesis protein ResB